jgi:hypothetical protein
MVKSFFLVFGYTQLAGIHLPLLSASLDLTQCFNSKSSALAGLLKG